MSNTLNITNLDFDSIKTSLQTYLSSNTSPFADYNYEGSVISTLLDVLAYNTYYNSFYLNMVSNEMFLDTALKRSSVISHAKILNYTPRSSVCPKATISMSFNNVTSSSLTIPKYTRFRSAAVNGVNYPFVTLDSYTAHTDNSNSVTFNSVDIYQGQPVSYTFNVDNLSNPNQLFKLPDSSIDTKTLYVKVFNSSSSTTFDVYTLSDKFLTLDDYSKVYFIQESLDGYYEIYFGDGVLGNHLTTGNVIVVEYLTTNGSNSNGVSTFTLMDKLSGVANSPTLISFVNGEEREPIDSIKFQAPKSFSAQNRAVTPEDYITALQQNSLGYSFDSVNVWGGENNDPPIYGKIFASIKPSGGYVLTDIQKQKIISDIIKPISVMTVAPTIVDPDYTYINVSVNVVYDQKLTTLTASQIETSLITVIKNFGVSTLNTFNSTFMLSELNSKILNSDPSIITNEINIKLQKKFFPELNAQKQYKLYYGTALQKGILLTGVSSYPSYQATDPDNLSSIIQGVFIEEVPNLNFGISSIYVINPGFSYQLPPTVTILGDGTGATAIANISASGSIKSIELTSTGSGYTSAIVKITPSSSDTTGQLGAAVVVLDGQIGKLRSYYYNSDKVKTILNDNVGTIDYVNGVITLNSFNPVEIDNIFGQLMISSTPASSIFSSSFNRIITIDPFDPNSVSVNVTAKK